MYQKLGIQNSQISNLLCILGKTAKKQKKKKKRWKILELPTRVWEEEFPVGKYSLLRSGRKKDPDTKNGLGTKLENSDPHLGAGAMVPTQVTT